MSTEQELMQRKPIFTNKDELSLTLIIISFLKSFGRDENKINQLLPVYHEKLSKYDTKLMTDVLENISENAPLENNGIPSVSSIIDQYKILKFRKTRHGIEKVDIPKTAGLSFWKNYVNGRKKGYDCSQIDKAYNSTN